MKEDTLSLTAASDQNYAMGLCVMIRSVLENLQEGIRIHLYILEDHIEEDTKKRMEASWEPYPITTFWISPDNRVLQGKVQERGHAGVVAAYYRFFIADLLPPDVKKVIYLDADMIVKGDLAELDAIPMTDYPVMAAPDAYTAYFHISIVRTFFYKKSIL